MSPPKRESCVMRSPDSAAAPGAPKIRVLLLTDEMEVGGTQRQIVHIASQLDRSRFEPTVIYFVNRSFFVDELERSGVPVIHVPKRGKIDPVFVWRLRHALREGRFDVTHCFAYSGEFWGTLARRLLPRRARPALISSVRGTYEWYSRWNWIVKRWVSAQSHRVVANSRIAAAYAALHLGWPDAAISITYNGVQPPQVSPQRTAAVRHALALGEHDIFVLFVGRLVVHKDVPCLLRAAARLRDTAPTIRWRLAGDGPLENEITQQIAAHGLQDHVQLLGQRDDVQDLIDAADIVVLPSLREGLSNVILEGMMGGKPVVASNAGGNVELVIDGETGLLFPIGDDAAMAAALQRLAQDGHLRRRLGDGASRRAQAAFSIPAMVHSFETLYGDAARARRAAL
jgi:glycosyltransferase involved in cell wall biosynthesis